MTSATIPALVHGVALGEPPRRVSPLLRVVVVLGGSLLVAPLAVAIVFLMGRPTIGGAVVGALVLGFLLVSVHGRLRALRLLEHGVVGYGRHVGSERRGRLNAVSFELVTTGGEAVVATVTSDSPRELEDDEQEPLLYDPERPTRVLLLDNLPGNPRVDGDGRLTLTSPWRGVMVLALVALQVAVVVAILASWTRAA